MIRKDFEISRLDNNKITLIRAKEFWLNEHSLGKVHLLLGDWNADFSVVYHIRLKHLTLNFKDIKE